MRTSDLWLRSSSSDDIVLLSDAGIRLDGYSLKGSEALIWEMCNGNNSVADISELICRQYPNSAADQVTKDVVAFLEELSNESLVYSAGRHEVDVLLVMPPPPSVYNKDAVSSPEFSSPPLGLGYLAAALRDAGHKVAIADLHQSGGSPEAVVEYCRRHNAKIVGITATTPSYPNALRVARHVKAWNGDAVVVMGGPHATCAPNSCAMESAVDFVAVGEAEQSFTALVGSLLRGAGNPHSIDGFVSKNGDQVVSSSPSARLRNLDLLPMPARDLLDMNSYHKKGAIVSSRGCPIGCNFCSCAAIVGNTYRVHSVDRVAAEIAALRESYGLRHFDFHDDTFNLSKERVFSLCKRLEAEHSGIEWGCFCRAAQMSPAMARKMVTAGCRVVQFGVEAGSDKSMRALGKRTTVKQISDAVKWCKAAGMEQIVCGFIIGHADDTEDDVRATISLGEHLALLGATRLTLSLLTPYPGTEVYENRADLGIELITDDWEQYTFSRVVAETRYLKRDRLRELYVEGLLRFMDASTK